MIPQSFGKLRKLEEIDTCGNSKMLGMISYNNSAVVYLKMVADVIPPEVEMLGSFHSFNLHCRKHVHKVSPKDEI